MQPSSSFRIFGFGTFLGSLRHSSLFQAPPGLKGHSHTLTLNGEVQIPLETLFEPLFEALFELAIFITSVWKGLLERPGAKPSA